MMLKDCEKLTTPALRCIYLENKVSRMDSLGVRGRSRTYICASLRNTW